jgi:hypothetical protein
MNWLKILNSPFKPFKIKWYFGKTAIGVPYFYPRKWINNPEKNGYMIAIPLKVGFSYCGLGWKTKWTNTDYRHEWNPVLSFVFFGYQIAVTLVEPEHTYWETWLYYENNTDKSKSQLERILDCMENYPNIWIKYDGDKKIEINYYKLILKNKYLKYIKDCK